MEDLAALVLVSQRLVARVQLFGDPLRERDELDQEEVQAGGGDGGICG